MYIMTYISIYYTLFSRRCLAFMTDERKDAFIAVRWYKEKKPSPYTQSWNYQPYNLLVQRWSIATAFYRSTASSMEPYSSNVGEQHGRYNPLEKRLSSFVPTNNDSLYKECVTATIPYLDITAHAYKNNK